MNKLSALTSLRFFAALAIVIEHSRGAFASMGWIGDFPFDYGVSFFFVLSGFILTIVYHERLDSPRSVFMFYTARVARIWPLHLMMLLLFVMLMPSSTWLVGGFGADSLRVILANVFLVQSWVPRVRYFFSLNAVSWSISTEMFFYLMFPILRHRWAQTWHWKTLLIFLSTTVILTIATARGIPDVDFSNPMAVSSSGIGYIWPFVRINEFLLGMMAGSFYLMYARSASGGLVIWTLVELSSMASIWGLHAYMNDLPSRLVGHSLGFSAWTVFIAHCGASFGFALVILFVAVGRGALSRMLSWRPLVILGNASFAFYLVHQLILGLVYIHRGDFLAHIPDSMQCVGYWMVSLASAFVLWRFVEEPAREAIKKISLRKLSVAKA
ncbi:acyltransferase family protein [Burkholderia vietnamiensis]